MRYTRDVVAIAAAVSLLLVGCSDDSDDESADLTAPTEPVVVEDPPASADVGDGPALAGGTWLLVAHGNSDLPGCDFLGDVLRGGPGFVAVGSAAEHSAPAVWTSIDGVTWSRATDVPDTAVGGPGTGGLHTVAVGGPGLVALRVWPGPSGVIESVVWTSLDGVTWTHVGDGGFGDQFLDLEDDVVDVVAAGPGLVAVGGALVWTSPAGQTWTLVADDTMLGDDTLLGDEIAFLHLHLHGVAVGGPGLVAVGESWTSSGGQIAAVWTSPDGVTWTRVAHDEAVFGEGGNMRAVVAGGPGLVAVGETAGRAAIWTSPDGLTWTRLDDDAFDRPRTEPLADVVEANGHLVAIGRDGSLWTSTDGAYWTTIPHEIDDEPVPVWVYAAATDQNKVVVVGHLDGYPCAVWNVAIPD